MAPRKPTRNREQQLRIGDAIPIVVVADPYPNPSVTFSELPFSSVRIHPTVRCQDLRSFVPYRRCMLMDVRFLLARRAYQRDEADGENE
jgi:hypothetical protein